MAWTKSGTVSVTNGSAIVYGSGTAWASDKITRAGDIFKAPDGRDYEVLSVQSNTQMTLASLYLGTTVSGQAYALVHTGLLPAELAVAVSDMVSNNAEETAQRWEWETSLAATVNMKNLATGVVSAVKSLAKIISDIAEKAPKSSPSFTDSATVAGPVGGIAFSVTDNTNSSLFIKPQVGGVLQDTAGGGEHRWGTSGVAKMFLNYLGFLGIGTAPSVPLHVVNSVTGEVGRFTNQNGAGLGGVSCYNNTGSYLYVGVRGSTTTTFAGEAVIEVGATPLSIILDGKRRFRLGIDGAVTIGVDNAPTGGTWPLTTRAQARGLYATLTDNSGYGAYFAVNDGAVVSGSINLSGNTASYTSSSDYRLKYGDERMTGALELVNSLRPIRYKWKSDDSIGEGFFAHELQAVCPLAVTGEKDQVDDDGSPVYQSVDMAKIVPILVAAIQEQQLLIAGLQSRVATIDSLA